MSLAVRGWIAGLTLGLLAACSEQVSQPRSEDSVNPTPPPMPENAQTVEFTRDADVAPDSEGARKARPSKGKREIAYWGIEPGEPLPLMWEDLMPEGAAEELFRQQEEFYAMLMERYAANASTLADADTFEAIEEGSELDYMPQLGTFDVVEDLDGQLIRIPGYVVPFDFDMRRRQSEFLFVPYMGACIHTPPPPPNQIIFVRADPAVRIRDIWVPYWLEGELRTEENRNGLGDAAYTLILDELDPYPIP